MTLSDELNKRDAQEESDARIKKKAEAINALPFRVRWFVLDALRVRAMDFVTDRIGGDAGADEAADVYRAIVGESVTDDAFDPDTYAEMAEKGLI